MNRDVLGEFVNSYLYFLSNLKRTLLQLKAKKTTQTLKYSVFLTTFIFILSSFSGCAYVSRHLIHVRCDRSILREASQKRGLAIKENVECKSQTKAELSEDLLDLFMTENSPAIRQGENAVLKLLGVFPEEFQYPKDLFPLYTQELLGAYIPERKSLIFIEGKGATRTLELHEFTHALQDQHFQLKTILSPDSPQDAIIAKLALIEGDASRMEHDICAKRTVEKSAALLEDSLHDFPHDRPFAVLVLSPYIFGEPYVCSILQQGGQLALDEKFISPPNSSLDLLDSTKNSSGSIPLQRMESGSYHDSLGRIFTMAILSRVMTAPESLKVTAGFDADDLEFREGKLFWTIVTLQNSEAKVLSESLEKLFKSIDADKDFSRANRKVIRDGQTIRVVIEPIISAQKSTK
jgi:hypothetical protein